MPRTPRTYRGICSTATDGDETMHGVDWLLVPTTDGYVLTVIHYDDPGCPETHPLIGPEATAAVERIVSAIYRSPARYRRAG